MCSNLLDPSNQATAVGDPLASYETAYAHFLQQYPSYEITRPLRHLRRTDYHRLDQQKQIYLDYTGGGLYAESQLQKHFDLLRTHVYGNPHSVNPTSLAMTELVEGTRRAVLAYFNAHDNYICIFTPNASGALKHVGESYPFQPGSRYLLTFDNHNSVNGIREFARQKGASFAYVPLTSPELQVDPIQLTAYLDQIDPHFPHLFSLPAQSNFSGVKHPLSYVTLAQKKGWDVLLDAAAFVPTNQLDLQEVQPDFVTLSFYKMFGYPTGIGALLIHKRAVDKLQRPWFAGGTVKFVTAVGDRYFLAGGEASFEDGTVDYLNIPAVKIGLDHLQQIGIDIISERVRCLTSWLIEQLYSLKHSNGRPLVRLYGPLNTNHRGGTITFNLYDPEEHLFNYRRIEELANHEGISLRTGCFCNPGASEMAEGITPEAVELGISSVSDINFWNFMHIMQELDNKSVGAIRVSVGLATNFADVYQFWRFIIGFCDQTNLSIGNVTFSIESCRVVRDSS